MSRHTRAPKTGSEIRQEQIVNAALELVGRDGLNALTILGVAQIIGVVPSGIYRHFSGKSAIIDAVFAHIGIRLRKNVETVCADVTDATERLRLLHKRHVEMIRQNKGIPRLIFSENVHADDVAGKHLLYEIIQAYRGQVAEIIRQGQQEGAVRSDISPEAVSLMFLGLIQPAAFLWHISSGAFDVTVESERCWQLFSRAIQPDSTTAT